MKTPSAYTLYSPKGFQRYAKFITRIKFCAVGQERSSAIPFGHTAVRMQHLKKIRKITYFLKENTND
jgi:hypothetical protein